MLNSTSQKTPKEIGSFRSSFTQKNRPNTNSTSRPKGKSKYAKKVRSNFKKAPVAAKPKGPVYAYTSECHGAPATKKACSATNKKDALLQGLGKFRCTECKKPCKVSVSKAKPAEALTQVGWKTVTELKEGDQVRATIPSNVGTVDGADMGRGTGTTREYTADSLKVLEGMAPAAKENPYITDPQMIDKLETLPMGSIYKLEVSDC